VYLKRLTSKGGRGKGRGRDEREDGSMHPLRFTVMHIVLTIIELGGK